MTDSDLLIVSPLDQSIPIPSSRSDELLRRVDDVFSQAVTTQDVYVALDACKDIILATKTSGLGLAKLLYLVWANWEEFAIEDDFDDVVYSYIGVHKHTVERYIKVWAIYAEHKVPSMFAPQLLQLNIKDQIPVANAIAQGYEISDAQWERIIDAPDSSSVAKIIREDVKSKAPRKSSLQLFIDARGSLWAEKEGNKQFVGSLEVHVDDPIIKQAIERIITNTGIMKR